MTSDRIATGVLFIFKSGTGIELEPQHVGWNIRGLGDTVTRINPYKHTVIHYTECYGAYFEFDPSVSQDIEDLITDDNSIEYVSFYFEDGGDPERFKLPVVPYVYKWTNSVNRFCVGVGDYDTET